MKWRPILAGIVTLRELHEDYSVEDLLDLHEAMDIKDALESEEIPPTTSSL